jgi:hypothetical protein
MKNTRPNRFIYAAATLFATIQCHAGELLRFDSPHLVIERNGAQIRGHYGAAVPNFSCDFYFFGLANDQNNEATITSFATSDRYPNRKKHLDIKGKIFIDADKNWEINLEDEPPGCGGAPGTFSVEPGEQPRNKFKQQSSENMSGIRVVKRKSALKQAGASSGSKLFLLKGDTVLVSKSTASHSYIEHQPIGGDATVKGWIRTSDLSNPFP